MDIDARADTENNQSDNDNTRTGKDYVSHCTQKGGRSALRLCAASVSILLLLSSLLFLKLNVYASVVADSTATPSATVTQSDTTTTTVTQSPTTTDTATPDPTVTDTPTNTPSPTPTVTRTPRHTPTPQPSPTVTDTPQPTATATATAPAGTTATATPQGGSTPQATPTVQATGTVAPQNSGTGQTPTSNLTPTLNAGVNKPAMPQSQSQGGGMFPFPVFILTGILAGFGLIGAFAIAAIFIRRRAFIPLKPGTNLPPSGAKPWQRVRDNSFSLDGNTNLYGEPISNSAPTLAIQPGSMPAQNAAFASTSGQGMFASAQAGFLSSPSPTPFAFATDNLLPESGSLPAVRNNQHSGYLHHDMDVNDLLPESDVFPAVQDYQHSSASPDSARSNFSPQPVSVPSGAASSARLNRSSHYKRGTLRLQPMENSGSAYGNT